MLQGSSETECRVLEVGVVTLVLPTASLCLGPSFAFWRTFRCYPDEDIGWQWLDWTVWPYVTSLDACIRTWTIQKTIPCLWRYQTLSTLVIDEFSVYSLSSRCSLRALFWQKKARGDTYLNKRCRLPPSRFCFPGNFAWSSLEFWGPPLLVTGYRFHLHCRAPSCQLRLLVRWHIVEIFLVSRYHRFKVYTLAPHSRASPMFRQITITWHWTSLLLIRFIFRTSWWVSSSSLSAWCLLLYRRTVSLCSRNRTHCVLACPRVPNPLLLQLWCLIKISISLRLYVALLSTLCWCIFQSVAWKEPEA